MKLLVLGCKGQLGRCLTDQLFITDYDVLFTSRDEIDISNFEETRKKINKISPCVVINATAYTSVDMAEEYNDQADLINHLSVANVAGICRDVGCWFLHVSTDYVFDGTSSLPYIEADRCNPQGVYGHTKFLGEESIKSSGCKYLILRTSWVFSEYGNNFLKTMLKLAESHNELRVVDDQIGCPTSAQEIARTLVDILPYIEKRQLSSGIYNFCSDGPCSWYEFAKEIFMVAEKMGFPTPKNVYPISSLEYPTKAVRPAYSVLNCSKIYKEFKIESHSWKNTILPVMRKL